jgi:2-amino-4-hydroxy-6-hydroxymethyldihydropteridine diphosphokinase
VTTLHQAYLLLGSNLSRPAIQLKRACDFISKKVGQIIKKSYLYQTAAWGKHDQPDFLNQVLLVETHLSPESLLSTILNIEQRMGRVRTIKNAPRKIDIDILFYDDIIIDKTDLKIPHPLIAQRRFVLTPLYEISPDYIHPVHQENMEELLKKCPDPLDVKRI